MKGIAKELQDVGILRSGDELCELLQLGRHRLLQPPRPDVFHGVPDRGCFAKIKSFVELEDTAEKQTSHVRSPELFAQGLVTLWSLGLHHQAHKRFLQQFSAFNSTEPSDSDVRGVGGGRGCFRTFEGDTVPYNTTTTTGISLLSGRPPPPLP